LPNKRPCKSYFYLIFHYGPTPYLIPEAKPTPASHNPLSKITEKAVCRSVFL